MSEKEKPWFASYYLVFLWVAPFFFEELSLSRLSAPRCCEKQNSHWWWRENLYETLFSQTHRLLSLSNPFPVNIGLVPELFVYSDLLRFSLYSSLDKVWDPGRESKWTKYFTNRVSRQFQAAKGFVLHQAPGQEHLPLSQGDQHRPAVAAFGCLKTR